MQTWEEYFQGEDYLSNAELEEIKQKLVELGAIRQIKNSYKTTIGSYKKIA